MAGFFAKYFLLFAGASNGHYILVIIAALNIVVALYYYLKVIRVIFMEPNDQPVAKISSHWQPRLAMAICMGGILVTGIASGAYHYIYSLVK
jgi:NADH-quinone oxidoreductase subunit N